MRERLCAFLFSAPVPRHAQSSRSGAGTAQFQFATSYACYLCFTAIIMRRQVYWFVEAWHCCLAAPEGSTAYCPRAAQPCRSGAPANGGAPWRRHHVHKARSFCYARTAGVLQKRFLIAVAPRRPPFFCAQAGRRSTTAYAFRAQYASSAVACVAFARRTQPAVCTVEICFMQKMR